MQYDYGKNKKEHPEPVKAEVKGKSKGTRDNVFLLQVYNTDYFAAFSATVSGLWLAYKIFQYLFALPVFLFKASKEGMHVQ